MANAPQKSKNYFVVSTDMYPAEDPKYKPFVSRSTSAPTVGSGQEALLVEYVVYEDQINTDPYKLIGWTSGPVGTYGTGEKWLFYDGTGTPDSSFDNAIKGGWVALDLTYYYYDNNSKEYKGSGKLSEKPDGCTAVFNNPPLVDNKLADTGTYDIKWNNSTWSIVEKPKWDENTAMMVNVYTSDDQLQLTGVNTTEMPAKNSMFLVEMPKIDPLALNSRDIKDYNGNVLGKATRYYPTGENDNRNYFGCSSYIGYRNSSGAFTLYAQTRIPALLFMKNSAGTYWCSITNRSMVQNENRKYH